MDIRQLSDTELFDLKNKADAELTQRGYYQYPGGMVKFGYQKDALVNVVITEMEPIPPNSNPFHHDRICSGTSLAAGWSAMFSQSTHWKGLYLVNENSGQRIGLTFIPKQLDIIVDNLQTIIEP